MKKNALTICLALALAVAIVFCFIFNGQKTEVQKQLTDTAASLETAVADASRLQEELDSAKEELTAAVSSLEAKTAEAEASKAAGEALQAELDNVTAELASAKEAAETALTSHEEETAVLREELAKVTAQAEAAEEKIEAIRSVLAGENGETGEMTSLVSDEGTPSSKTPLEVLVNLLRAQGKAVSLKRVPTYLGKYLRDGQALSASLRFAPGGQFSSLYPDEKISAALTDLINGLGFRAAVQAEDRRAQADFALQLSGEDALDLRVAMSRDGIFAKSALLGEGTYAATPAELKAAALNLISRMAESGNLPREQAEAVLKLLGVISLPTAQELQSIDFSGLRDAVLRSVSSWTVLDTAAQPPEALPEADTVLVIPVEKEQLRVLLDEAAKVMVQFPSVQTELSGRGLTEEGLIFKISSLADYLVEDTAVRIYTSPDYKKCYLTFTASLKGRQSVMDACSDLLSCAEDGALSVRYTSTVTLDGRTVEKAGTAVLSEKTFTGTDTICTRAEDGTPIPLSETEFNCSADYTDVRSEIELVSTARLYVQPGADPVVLTVRTAAENQDLGDHAEGTVTTVIERESVGEILTVHFSEKTEPAGAYLCDDPEAIHPMALTKEERDALKQTFMNSAQTALTDFLRKLPESLFQIMMPAQ